MSERMTDKEIAEEIAKAKKQERDDLKAVLRRWVPLSARENAAKLDVWFARGDAFIREIQEARDAARANEKAQAEQIATLQAALAERTEQRDAGARLADEAMERNRRIREALGVPPLSGTDDDAIRTATSLRAERDLLVEALGKVCDFHEGMVHGEDCPRGYHDRYGNPEDCGECAEGETCPECDCCLGVADVASAALSRVRAGADLAFIAQTTKRAADAEAERDLLVEALGLATPEGWETWIHESGCPKAIYPDEEGEDECDGEFIVGKVRAALAPSRARLSGKAEGGDRG